MADHEFSMDEAVRAALSATREEYTRLAPIGSQNGHNGHKPAEAPAPIFRLLTDVEAENMPPAEGILGDVLFEDSIAFLYGPSGFWKSFVALDWGMCIATGAYWLGRVVKPGPVVYVTAEGARSFGKRIRAWKHHNGVQGQTSLYVMSQAVHLLMPAHVDALLAAVRAALGEERPVLLVIDTLARSLAGGHENDTGDAERLIAAAERVRREYGCCVLFVHHTGKDSSLGMRGNSVFFNDADTVIYAAGDENAHKLQPGDLLRLVSKKAKDTDEFKTIPVTAEVEEWSGGAFDTSSLVIVAGDRAAVRSDRPLARNVQRALDVFYGLEDGHPEGVAFVPWRDRTEAIVGVSRDTARRYIKELEKDGHVWCDPRSALYRLPRYLRAFEEEQAERTAEIARQMKERLGQGSEAENGA